MAKVTVAIPTLNGSRYIEEAISSVLKQTYDDFELLIIDNYSTDGTKKIVQEFRDPRIQYIRNPKQVNIITNWNNCLKSAKGDYLLILGDDDSIYPSFLQETVMTLDNNQEVGFVYAKCYKVDEKGKNKAPWGYQYMPQGKHSGADYIIESAKLGVNLTNSTTTLINLNLVKKVGQFSPEVSDNTFDFNMWLKIANVYPVYFINEFLASYREHDKQVSKVHWRGKFPSGKIGTQLEIINALTRLNQDNKEDDIRLIGELVEKSLLRLRNVLKDFDPSF
jgi:glycosyltransferase involved in cell wall biosynthesis